MADSQWNVQNCTTTSTCQITSKIPGTAYRIPASNGTISWQDGQYNDYETPIPSGYDLTDAEIDRAPEWQYTVDGTYVLPLKKSVRDAEGLTDEGPVTVHLVVLDA